MNHVDESEEFQVLTSYFDTCPFGVLVLHNNAICQVNRHFMGLVGIDEDELLGKKLAELVSSDDRSKLSSVKKLKGREVELRFMNHNQQPVWCKLKYSQQKVGDNTYSFYHVQQFTKERINHSTLRNLLDSITSSDEASVFESTVMNLGEALNTYYAFTGIYDPDTEDITIRAMCINGELQSPFSYAIADTPCGDVIMQGCVALPKDTQDAYPNDHYLVDWEVDSYVGVPLKNSLGKTIGHLAVMDTKPIENPELITSLLNMFAYRLGIVMEKESNAQQMRMSEERYKSLFNNSFEATLIYDRNAQRILEVNQAAVDLFLYSREEFCQLSYKDIKPVQMVDGTPVDDHVDNHYRLIDSGKKINTETLSMKANGTVFETEVAISPFGQDRNLLIVSYRDISEKKQAQRALQISEKQFRSLFEHSFDAIFLYNIEENIYENCNVRATELFKYNRDQLLKMSPEQLASPVQKNFINPIDALKTQTKVLKKNKKLHFEFNFLRADQTVFEAEVSLLPLIDEAQKYCITVIKDISLRKKQEQELKERENFLKQIIDLNPNLVYGKDKDLRFTLANQATGDFLGVNPESLIGGKWEDFCLDTNEAELIRDSDMEILKQKQVIEMSSQELTHSDGTKRYFQTSKMPILNEEGEVELILNVSTDITSHIQMENKLTESNEELKRVNSELDHYVYRASHDLRAPLASILGLTNLIKVEDSMDGLKKYNLYIEEQIGKLDGFIREIINYSRISRTGSYIEKIDLEGLVMDTYDSLMYMKDATSVEKRLDFEGKSDFCSDMRSIRLIIKNLLTNAIKYCDPLKEKPFVHCAILVDEANVFINVKDNGIGIKDDYIDQVYEMFFRATELSDGSGLGLFMVKQSVDKLDGYVSICSTFREGTEFKIVLPNRCNELK
ncbi:MAG: PAS domain S-box protein [Bacteroidota bacterium]